MKNIEQDIDYNALAAAIAKNLHKMPKPEQVLWNTEECANYLKVAPRQFRERIAKACTFPSPVKIPDDRGRLGLSRYYMNDVVSWAATYKRKN